MVLLAGLLFLHALMPTTLVWGTTIRTLHDTTCSSGTRYNSTYDDLPPPLPAAPQLSKVGTYNGIKYTGFVVGDPKVPILSKFKFCIPMTKLCIDLSNLSLNGVKNKGGQEAAIGLLETITQVGNLTFYPYGVLSPAQDVASIDVLEFYFGCLINDGNAVLAPSSHCVIELSGETVDGTPVEGDVCTFKPTSLLQSELSRCGPTKLTRMKEVKIGLAAASVAPALTVLVVDNLITCIHRL